MNFCCCSLLFFNKAPQVVKDSGAEGEEEIGDSQEHVRIIQLATA